MYVDDRVLPSSHDGLLTSPKRLYCGFHIARVRTTNDPNSGPMRLANGRYRLEVQAIQQLGHTATE